MILDDKCGCVCHKKDSDGNPMAYHCMPCCQRCSNCGEYIRIAFMYIHARSCVRHATE